MRRFAAVLLLAAGCAKPETGPAPIAYGEDYCDLCKMIISEANFAAEARFGPDAVEKFDDIGCLGERLWKSPPPVAMWVADHSTGALRPLESMSLVHVKDLKTPMASGVAAFADRGQAEDFKTKNSGRTVGLDEIKSMRRPNR